ncbi:hypothetical protein [Nonlabens xiamenensis]|uniref:hypothetical protein n=1 Tax=Nonlabens xiamenensis TaxID=2341043 RepID=UPI000F60EFC9|nr:hypothetical protein [Nonlabens xiamenensis]
MDILNITTSIVSILGALWTLYNWNEIKKAKEQIFSAIKIVKYSEVSNNFETTIKQIKKIAFKTKIPSGTNIDDILNSLTNYFEKTVRTSSDLEKDGFRNFSEHKDELKTSINNISKLDRKSPNNLIEEYNKVYYIIIEMDKEIDNYRKKLVQK